MLYLLFDNEMNLKQINGVAKAKDIKDFGLLNASKILR